MPLAVEQRSARSLALLALTWAIFAPGFGVLVLRFVKKLAHCGTIMCMMVFGLGPLSLMFLMLPQHNLTLQLSTQCHRMYRPCPGSSSQAGSFVPVQYMICNVDVH